MLVLFSFAYMVHLFYVLEKKIEKKLTRSKNKDIHVGIPANVISFCDDFYLANRYRITVPYVCYAKIPLGMKFF